MPCVAGCCRRAVLQCNQLHTDLRLAVSADRHPLGASATNPGIRRHQPHPPLVGCMTAGPEHRRMALHSVGWHILHGRHASLPGGEQSCTDTDRACGLTPPACPAMACCVQAAPRPGMEPVRMGARPACKDPACTVGILQLHMHAPACASDRQVHSLVVSCCLSAASSLHHAMHAGSRMLSCG